MFTRETSRYDWSLLRCAPLESAVNIPKDLERLASANTVDEAHNAYWGIDNIVVVQGALYEAAVPTVIYILSILQYCTDVARPFILELLEIIGEGEPSILELEIGNRNIAQDCLREICRGVPIFFRILEFGTQKEKEFCVDLLFLCCSYDNTLRDRVVWWFQQLLSYDIEPYERAYIEGCLEDL